MKRLFFLVLALLFALSLGACGQKEAEQPAPVPLSPAGRAGAAAPTPAATPFAAPTAAPAAFGSYRRVDITPDNWTQYFALREIPLYCVYQGEVIAQVEQRFCVVLREEYQPFLKPEGAYAVDFRFRFDIYVDTMDIDTNTRSYRHTDDLFYAVQVEKSARFDCHALSYAAYGMDNSVAGAAQNTFFTGYAVLHAESLAWSGFYVDLSQVELLSVSGYIELAQ